MTEEEIVVLKTNVNEFDEFYFILNQISIRRRKNIIEHERFAVLRSRYGLMASSDHLFSMNFLRQWFSVFVLSLDRLPD